MSPSCRQAKLSNTGRNSRIVEGRFNETKRLDLAIIHTIGGLSLNAGGPARSVPALCAGITQHNPSWRVEIVAGRNKRLGPNDAPCDVPVIELSDAYSSRAFVGQLAERLDGSGATILHDHGQWLPINHASATVARRFQVPRIVSPRGMLSPWARKHHRWKKGLAWSVYGKRDLRDAQVLHATSLLEADELRELGARQPIAVIPNGVDAMIPLADDIPRPPRPYVLFLSRLHLKKGLKELLDVWQNLDAADWELVLAGPDEDALLPSLSLPPNVRYVGTVDGATKARLFQQASLFILPSHSENFGIVVAEALMAGVPVITTHGTPWQSLEKEQCGWWIPMQETHLRRTLRHALAMPQSELQKMGCRGREFARREFCWARIANEMATVYQWMLGGGTSPECIARE
jgi:glycosyltransferase involved in cell wall biosynthesis